ncbi:hypothetical protein C482_12007 [Natrialba chahannaoensis JCM 10990]|uniref:Uncharacterized protein n=1 Tax=Natrialba chahannaoensis JCM 10990 TaxID=1227492 RepID=M0AK05_9EURY|nr:hypothetical protein [Natrialba chahannaoensis]ELY98242.1 hypothetical protein C482_12007 [Natrialba chahannaoensis JCM 10990]
MGLKETLMEWLDVLDGQELTGRQAGLIVAVWLLLTALFGLVVFAIVFVQMGF